MKILRRTHPLWLVPVLAIALLSVEGGLFVAPASVPSAAALPTAPAGRLLLVSVDGLRPDVLLRANAPVLRGLMAGGAFTLYAETTDVAITLPSHTSMLTGLTPARHDVS